MQQEVYDLIRDGRYAEDIIAYLMGRYRMPREHAYAFYMNINSSIPLELDDDGEII